MAHPIAHWSPALSALELRGHLIQLEAERALALTEGLGSIDAYMTDLDSEIEHRRHDYVVAGVVEMAILRAELFGAQTG
jgi:hypothetical protein